jgi:hypothetical protein
MLPPHHQFLQAPSLTTNIVQCHAFTAGNAKTQVIESKRVIKRKPWAALQFPIGDDVSALLPLRSSVGFSRCAQALILLLGQKPTMQIEYACFIMQG